MDQAKNNKEYIYSYIASFVIILIIILFFLFKKNINQDNIVKVNTNTGTETVITADKIINSGEYKEVINTLEEKGINNLKTDDKMDLVYSYLNYGNYFNKEEENSKKALDILNAMEENFNTLYYKGYANEIIKKYTEALDYYNKALEIKDLPNNQKSAILNQIGHLYDLKGEFDKVFEYYNEAYNLDKGNERVLSNLGRYYTRIGEYQKAYDLLNDALNLTSNLPMKAEISFGLSSLELELNGFKPDIDKSIDYSKQAIEYYPSYSMGYVALAKGLYMKNDSVYDKEIEKNLNKSIELNPNGHYAYYLFALYEFDKGNYDVAGEYIKKTINTINKDMILMDSEREKKMNTIFFDAIMIGTLRKNPKDPNLLLKLINKTGKLSNSKIIFQIKRDNYGIFAPLKDNEEFLGLINNYKK